jgi:hypothetical protein
MNVMGRLAILFSLWSSAIVAAEPAFTVVVDEAYKRPLIRRAPPTDRNDEKPLDVVQKFLKAVNDGDFKAAEKLCLFGYEFDKHDWKTCEGDDFQHFNEKVRRSVKQVTLSSTAVPSSSSSFVYSKGHYWSVWYRPKFANDKQQQGYFLLLQVDGVWKILEKPHWRREARGDPLPDELGNPTLPQW